jgi:hypothetical protein
VEEATMKKKKVSQEEASYSNSCKLLLLRVELVDMPGGPEAFEMAVRFCLNMNHVSDTSISSSNVVMLRCAAEFLDMGEAMCKGNLKKKTEDYLRAMVFMGGSDHRAAIVRKDRTRCCSGENAALGALRDLSGRESFFLVLFCCGDEDEQSNSRRHRILFRFLPDGDDAS